MINVERKNPDALKKLVERPTDIFTVRELDVELLRPERLRIKLADDIRLTPLDFGALCYERRERLFCNTRERNKIIGRSDHVDLSSLRTERRTVIAGLVDLFLVNGSRENTIKARHAQVSVVFDWCDLSGHSDFLTSKEAARVAYILFIDSLFAAIHAGKYKPYTLLPRQHAMWHLLELRFGKADEIAITSGITPLRAASSSVQAPKKEAVVQYFDVVKTLALSLSDNLLNEKPFPFLLEFMNYSTYRFAVHQRGVKTPYTSNEAKTYNFIEGRLATFPEYMENYQGKKCEALRTLNKAQVFLNESNSNSRCGARIECGATAMKAWACVFFVLTGANEDVFRNLEYDSALEVVKSPFKKSLSSIKFRANGKNIRLPIGREQGLFLLKKYLSFRAWMLNGQECKWLFLHVVGANYSPKRDFKKMPTGLQSRFCSKTLSGIYLPPGFKNITTGLSRKYKSAILHELQTSPSIVAGVMGHKPSTNLSHYAEPYPGQAERELGKYWASIRKAADKIKIQEIGNESSDQKTTSGHCNLFGSPEPVVEYPPINPNCEKQSGCLFCEHYECHADEEDLHKLLSYKYVIGEIIEQAEDVKHADDLLSGLMDRIDEVVNAIAESSNLNLDLVHTMKKRVFSLGILTPFWEKRMQRYEAVGIIL